MRQAKNPSEGSLISSLAGPLAITRSSHEKKQSPIISILVVSERFFNGATPGWYPDKIPPKICLFNCCQKLPRNLGKLLSIDLITNAKPTLQPCTLHHSVRRVRLNELVTYSTNHVFFFFFSSFLLYIIPILPQYQYMAMQSNFDFEKPMVEEAAKVNAAGIGPTRTRREAPELIRNLSPEERKYLERRLVRKIDLRLMPTIIIMYIMNYLDRNNIASARLQGLQQDLKMNDTEYQVGIYPVCLAF
jgi:hypothetical protein